MKLGTKFSFITIVIVVVLSILLELISLTVFRNAIHNLDKELFMDKVDRLILLAYEQDELFFEGVYKDALESRLRVRDKIGIDYRKQKNLVTFPFIVETNGRTVLHPAYSQWAGKVEDKEEGKQIFDSATLAFMREEKEGELEYTSGGMRRWCVFKIYEPWNWVFCMTTTTANKNKAIISFLWLALLISVAVIIVSVLAVLIISRKYIQPIHLVIERLLDIASGKKKFDQLININIKTKDEIGMLAYAVNKMAEDLQKTTVSRNELVKEIEERKKAEEELRQQKDFIQKALDSFNTPFYVVNLDYTIALANEAAKEKGIFEGGYCYQVTHRQQNPCDGKHVCPLREVLRTGKEARMEHIHYDKDGNETVVELHGYPLFNKDGQIVQMIELNYDITERKKAEEALKEYTKKIEQINKELDDFTYIISHDLKEPLRSIDAFSKFITDDYKDKLDEQGRFYIERVRMNASRMQKLIEDLLEISRIERKKNILEEMEAEELIEEVKLRMEVRIKEKNVQITIRDKLPRVYCDRVRLTEVFANLISNAIKFNDKPMPLIEIGSSEKEGFYEFYVKDNGPGIEEQYFDKIFEIFQRLGKREDNEGTGAGLTIVKKIVQMHKGKIWLESKIGEGTKFYFTIPTREKMSSLCKKKIGEILIEKKLITEEEIKKALEEQEGAGI